MVWSVSSGVSFRGIELARGRVPGSGRALFLEVVMVDTLSFWMSWIANFWSVSLFQYFWFIFLLVFIFSFIRRLIHIH